MVVHIYQELCNFFKIKIFLISQKEVEEKPISQKESIPSLKPIIPNNKSEVVDKN